MNFTLSPISVGYNHSKMAFSKISGEKFGGYNFIA